MKGMQWPVLAGGDVYRLKYVMDTLCRRCKAGFPFALFSLINELDQVKALGDRAGLYRTFHETGPIAVGVFMSRCGVLKG